MSTSHEPPTRAEGLRERHGLSDVKEVSSSTAAGDAAVVEDVEKEKKTFGRTPDGTSTFLSCAPEFSASRTAVAK
jgi:hypothetical protein